MSIHVPVLIHVGWKGHAVGKCFSLVEQWDSWRLLLVGAGTHGMSGKTQWWKWGGECGDGLPSLLEGIRAPCIFWPLTFFFWPPLFFWPMDYNIRSHFGSSFVQKEGLRKDSSEGLARMNALESAAILAGISGGEVWLLDDLMGLKAPQYPVITGECVPHTVLLGPRVADPPAADSVAVARSPGRFWNEILQPCFLSPWQLQLLWRVPCQPPRTLPMQKTWPTVARNTPPGQDRHKKQPTTFAKNSSCRNRRKKHKNEQPS